MPPKSFSLLNLPVLENYLEFFRQGYWKSLAWSMGMAFVSTLLLLIVCWPLAFAMAKIFKRFTLILTIGVVRSLFVSENIRLFGWVLTLIVFGLVYVYFPFMLFPLAQGISMIPDDARQAAFDLGATRSQVLWEIELPLAAPGIMVGSLLCFVLAAGAVAESKLLGGQAVIVIADEVETAFTYGQNWPLGSALAMVLIMIIGTIAVVGISRFNLDEILGRQR